MHLDLKRLSYFKAIVDSGYISEAARRLGVPQPVLSYHLRELEADFGGPLLIRARSGVVPTDGGRILLDHATAILALVARASSDMDLVKHRAAAPRSVIRLAAIPSLATPLASLLLRNVEQELSVSGLYLVEARTEAARDMLRDGQVDYAVLLAAPQTPTHEILATENLLLVMGWGHEDRSSEPIPLREALAEPLVIPRRGNVRGLVDGIAQRIGCEVKVAPGIEGGFSPKPAIISGIGRSFLPWATARSEILGGEMRFRPVVDPPLERGIALEARPGADPAMTEALFRLLQQLIGPILVPSPEDLVVIGRLRDRPQDSSRC